MLKLLLKIKLLLSNKTKLNQDREGQSMKYKLLVMSILLIATNAVVAEANKFEEAVNNLKRCINDTKKGSDSREACYDDLRNLYKQAHPKKDNTIEVSAATVAAVATPVSDELEAEPKTALELASKTVTKSATVASSKDESTVKA
jgi:hypothetical protein